MRNPFEGYGKRPTTPLGGYAVLLGAYAAALGSFLFAARRRRLRTRPLDIVLVGVATHELTQTITQDWVTAPLRAAFTEYEESLGHGRVKERARGTGLRRAVGDLLTCPYCMGPWVAGALLAGIAVAPAPTRLVAGIFASVAVSDFLHGAYDAVAGRKQRTTAPNAPPPSRASYAADAGLPP